MAGPERKPGTDHTLAVMKRLSAMSVHKCALDRRKSVHDCWRDGDIKLIGEEWPGNGVRRPLGQCRYCFEVHPLDSFREDDS